MFVLIMGLMGASGVFYLASATQHWGWTWSYQVCRQGMILCDNPHWVLIAAGAAIIIEMVRSMSKA
jgi:hypothetical protein